MPGFRNSDLDRYITGNWGEDSIKDRECEHCYTKFNDEEVTRCPYCHTPFYCVFCDDEREFDDEDLCTICRSPALEE